MTTCQKKEVSKSEQKSGVEGWSSNFLVKELLEINDLLQYLIFQW